MLGGGHVDLSSAGVCGPDKNSSVSDFLALIHSDIYLLKGRRRYCLGKTGPAGFGHQAEREISVHWEQLFTALRLSAR